VLDNDDDPERRERALERPASGEVTHADHYVD
jgi:hypothetical protein